MNGHPRTLLDLVSAGDPAARAIGAPGRDWLSRGGLHELAIRTGDRLNRFGLGRNDRIAIVAPNGPAMATAFVAIGAFATTAPLNPGYKQAEFDFYLSDLDAKALVIPEGFASAARDVAVARGIPIIELVANPGIAGDFTLHVPAASLAAPAAPGPAQPGDIALVLHTSGTTARPKIVPLTQANVTASAANIAATLELGGADICLNIMPLFHIHGLIAAVLSSLAAGGATACASGLDGPKFFEWLKEIEPTWYTAVPSMHQAILKLAPRYRDTLARAKLRFIRSSSASLPPQVMMELEETFGVPVIEAYGMTEAAHQMASNPLPPKPRFPGSVGLAAGPELAIMDEAGAILPPGAVGEVVIRGANVTAGYEANPTANASAFTDGWFRTGDEGAIDAQGYLRLTGRIKEQINRGGEKVAPLEIDNVLMEHPAVQQALSFAIPDKDYGESVAAAIVLREGEAADARAIRQFAAQRLAAFKVPVKIVFLAEIPKGATGKLQRIGLAAKLGLDRLDA
jgi:acyl-CoA synthetase (AMP-forming)/AMP-acid ligase II